MAARILGGVCKNTSHIRESGSANVGTPQPSTPSSASPTSAATRRWSGWSSDR
jgi:hypothetical protein